MPFKEKVINRCPVCGEVIEKEIQLPLISDNTGSISKIVVCSCRCKREEIDKIENRFAIEEEKREVEKLRNASLLDAKSKNIFFKNCMVNNENRRVISIANRYVKNFDMMYEKSQGLLLWGGVGTGKSFLAAAIANELIQRRQSVIMTSFVRLLENGINTEDYSIIGNLTKAKLLIVDDLGAERGTDYALEKVYDIVDCRYRSGRPVIFTTNLTMKEMKECTDIRYTRIYDRIFEMCYPVKFDGLSWRKREAADRFDSAKKLLEE